MSDDELYHPAGEYPINVDSNFEEMHIMNFWLRADRIFHDALQSELQSECHISKRSQLVLCKNEHDYNDCWNVKLARQTPMKRAVKRKVIHSRTNARTLSRLKVDRELTDKLNCLRDEELTRRVSLRLQVDAAHPDELTEDELDRRCTIDSDLNEWCEGRLSFMLTDPFWSIMEQRNQIDLVDRLEEICDFS